MAKSKIRIITVSAATFVLFATAAQAQTYTTMPLGGGWSTTTGPNGFSATTVPMGGGMSVTTINPPMMQKQIMPDGWSTPTINPQIPGQTLFGGHVPGTPYQ